MAVFSLDAVGRASEILDNTKFSVQHTTLFRKGLATHTTNANLTRTDAVTFIANETISIKIKFRHGQCAGFVGLEATSIPALVSISPMQELWKNLWETRIKSMTQWYAMYDLQNMAHDPSTPFVQAVANWTNIAVWLHEMLMVPQIRRPAACLVAVFAQK